VIDLEITSDTALSFTTTPTNACFLLRTLKSGYLSIKTCAELSFSDLLFEVERVAFDDCDGGVKLLYDCPMCLVAFPLINDSHIEDGD
jgi:hypothetical protein